MRSIHLAGAVSLAAVVLSFASADTPAPSRPRTGPVEILRSSEIKPGMRGYAWTVFTGDQPEAVPVEIIGLWKNAWGPKQDVIIGKLGGKAKATNVAAGMSGSPVYIDGKLAGAIALRLSVFSPDAICGITPIELMLEINDFDATRPAGARTPDKLPARAALSVPAGLLAQTVSAGAQSASLFGSHHGAHRDAAAFLRIPRGRAARVRSVVPATGAEGGAGRRQRRAHRRRARARLAQIAAARATWSPACSFPAT